MKPSQHLPRKAQIRTNRLKLRCPRIQKSRTSERTSQEFLRHHQFEPQCPLRVKCCCRNNAPIAENESIPLSLSAGIRLCGFCGAEVARLREKEKGGSRSPAAQTSALLATDTMKWPLERDYSRFLHAGFSNVDLPSAT